MLIGSILAMCGAVAPQDPPGAVARIDPAGEVVRIVRDPWGVPHVLARSDAGALYGYGWALAEDQLEDVLSALWTAQGRRTEIDGPAALGIDRTHRLLKVTALLEQRWDRLPAAVRELSAAFAAGLNAYMAAHPDEVPGWAEPVRPAWPVGLGSLISLLPQIRRANDEAHELGVRMATLATGADDRHYIGSNAWALAPGRIAEGVGVVSIDPHLPWKHEFRLYEVHLRGASLEVAGAAFLGVPLPVFARNRDVAWGWTWNGPDHADVYRLRLDPADPGRYLLDGESLPFEVEHAVFRMPDGSRHEEDLLWSVHGPVVARDAAAGTAVAFRLSGFGLLDSATQMYELARARDLDDVERAMARLQVPHFNLVAGDRHGAIAYVWGGRVPRRAPGLDFSRPLDGSTRRTLWDADDVVPWAQLPRVRDPEVGFVQSCNNLPHRTTGTAEDPDPASYPPGVVASGEEDTLRSWYVRRRLGTAAPLAVDDLRALTTDGYMIPHAGMIEQLRRAWALVGDTWAHAGEVAREVHLLTEWDGMPRLRDPAPTLFTAWLYDYGDHRVFLPVAMLERDPGSLSPTDAEHMLDSLLQAKRDLGALLPVPQIPWGAVHVIRKGRRAVPVASGMYPAVSLMNANVDLRPGRGELPTCRIGSAYTAFHELGDEIHSWSVLPLGETDDPDRPYCYAMTELYGARRLKPLPFGDAELAAVETTVTELRFR